MRPLPVGMAVPSLPAPTLPTLLWFEPFPVNSTKSDHSALKAPQSSQLVSTIPSLCPGVLRTFVSGPHSRTEHGARRPGPPRVSLSTQGSVGHLRGQPGRPDRAPSCASGGVHCRPLVASRGWAGALPGVHLFSLFFITRPPSSFSPSCLPGHSSLDALDIESPFGISHWLSCWDHPVRCGRGLALVSR